jgi:hypothetical protein
MRGDPLRKDVGRTIRARPVCSLDGSAGLEGSIVRICYCKHDHRTVGNAIYENVSLKPELEDFIGKRVSSGLCQSPSEKACFG